MVKFGHSRIPCVETLIVGVPFSLLHFTSPFWSVETLDFGVVVSGLVLVPVMSDLIKIRVINALYSPS